MVSWCCSWHLRGQSDIFLPMSVFQAGSDVADYIEDFQLLRLVRIARLNVDPGSETCGGRIVWSWKLKKSLEPGIYSMRGRLWQAEEEAFDKDNTRDACLPRSWKVEPSSGPSGPWSFRPEPGVNLQRVYSIGPKRVEASMVCELTCFTDKSSQM